MARLPSAGTDFVVSVEGIGVFTFGKKSFRDQIAIEAEYSRLTEGLDNVTNFLFNLATAVSNLKVLTVTAPEGWSIADLDPDDADSYLNVMKVWGALRDKQATFRQGTKPVSQAAGPGNSGDAGVLVPPQV